MRKYVSIGIIILLGVLIVRGGSFFDVKLRASSLLGTILGVDFSSSKELRERIDALEKENERLKTELFGKSEETIGSIKVYSSYPFNSRSEIAIAAGADRGVSAGDTVVFGGGVLVGRVKSVFESSSIVTTIFDPSWEIAVRIGGAEADALLKGGNELKISLIPQEATIEEGDMVISADGSLPYGLEIGYIGKIDNSEGDTFKEAVLEPALKLRNLRDVSIYR